MTLSLLDETYPSDNANVVSDLGEAIRATRTAVNNIIKALGGNVTALTLVSGQSVLDLTELPDLGIVVLELSASSVVSISTIEGGMSGQILVLSFATDNITLVKSAELMLNGIGMFSNFQTEAEDVLVLFSDGTKWKEITRLVRC